MGTHIATAASLLVLASLGTARSKGKPDKPPSDGGGGGSSTSPVDYHLTLIPGTYGDTRIKGVNSAGIAVGTFYDSAGDRRTFWTDASGTINPIDETFVLPAGYETWSFERSDIQINESNQVAGVLVNDATGEQQPYLADLAPYLADLANPLSPVTPLGSVGDYSNHLRMNNQGDVVLTGRDAIFLYCAELDDLFALPIAMSEIPTGINDNLQISFVSWRDDGNNGFDGSFRYDFDPATQTGVLPVDLGSTLPAGSIPIARDILSDGSVVGFYYSNEARKRDRKAKAGFMDGSTLAWSEFNADLPTGGDIWIQSSSTTLRPAASAVSANEFGQVVGGYDVQNLLSGTDLWLFDPEDGLLHLDDLVVGADAENFRNWTWFWDVTISEIDSGTTYGIIAGSSAPDSSTNTCGFILTPRAVQP